MDRPHFVDPPIRWWLMCILHTAVWGVIKWLQECGTWSQATWVSILVVVVQLLSRVWLFVTPWTTAHQAPVSSAVSQSLLKFTSLSQWCYLTISSSAAPFSFCFQSFPASESFPTSWTFASGDPSIGASSSTSVLPMNVQGCFPLGSPCSSMDYQMTTGKALALTTWTFVCKAVFLPRSKHLLISWQSWSEVTLGPNEYKICHCFHFFLFYLLWSDGTGCLGLSFLNVEF